MSSMIVPKYCGWLKCKRCGFEFRIENTYIFVKKVNFCPYCGQKADPQRKQKRSGFDDDERIDEKLYK